MINIADAFLGNSSCDFIFGRAINLKVQSTYVFVSSINSEISIRFLDIFSEISLPITIHLRFVWQASGVEIQWKVIKSIFRTSESTKSFTTLYGRLMRANGDTIVRMRGSFVRLICLVDLSLANFWLFPLHIVRSR